MSLLGMFVCMTINAEAIDEIQGAQEIQSAQEIQNFEEVQGAQEVQNPEEVKNSEEVEAGEVHFPVLNPAMESSAFMSPYQSALPAIDESYRQSQEWKDALHLRNAGAIVCSVGIAGYVAGSVVMFAGVFDTTTTGDALGGLKSWEKGVIISGVSLIPLVSGAIMWGIGNKKLKKIRLRYTGNGLTMNF